MRILITNDDSISAGQLLPLIRWCQKIGEVTVAVPLVEQSGKSHGIELHSSFTVKEVALAPDITAYAVDSTPADCVRYAVLGRKWDFDLVISGINRGFNIGSDILYSGTVAAVCEANILGLPAIAISTSVPYYENAASHLDTVFAYLQAHRLLEVHTAYNINIPPEPKGIRITRQGGPYYSDDFVIEEDGTCTPVGKCVYQDSGDLNLDTDAVKRGYISVTPITITKTDLEMYRKLEMLNRAENFGPVEMITN